MIKKNVGRYIQYAVGEIILVVLGILIALWLNNLNQQRLENQEREKLKISLTTELLKNKERFNNFKNYADTCSKTIIKVLNISAGEETTLPIDSIRTLVVHMLSARSLRIDESLRNSASSAGRLELLTSQESKALSEYETTIENYKEARKINTIWKDSNRTLFLNLAVFEPKIRDLFPSDTLLQHPDFDLSNETFMRYLKSGDTYAKIKDIFISTLVDVNWLDSIIEEIDRTINVLNP